MTYSCVTGVQIRRGGQFVVLISDHVRVEVVVDMLVSCLLTKTLHQRRCQVSSASESPGYRFKSNLGQPGCNKPAFFPVYPSLFMA